MNLLRELMLIEEEKDKKESGGTYVGAKFDKATCKALTKMMKDLKIPKPLSEDNFHTTIIFSRKPFKEGFEALGDLKEPWVGKPLAFDIFTGRNDQNCLVLKYDCPEQKKRHEKLMKEHDATYDWPEYKVHLTLSYDCGDFDAKSIKPAEYLKEIVIANEYTTALDLDWLANKDKKKDDA